MTNLSYNSKSFGSNKFNRLVALLIFSIIFSFVSVGMNILDINQNRITTKDVNVRPEISSYVNGDTLIIKMRFNYVQLIGNSNEETQFNYDGFSVNQNSDEYGWPVLNVNLPYNNEGYHIEVIEHSYVDFPSKMSKAKDDLIDSEDTTGTGFSFNQNPDSSSVLNDKFMPENLFLCHKSQGYRGKFFLPITFVPIQYNEAKQISRISSSITYKIVFNNDSCGILNGSFSKLNKSLNIASEDKFYELIISSDILNIESESDINKTNSDSSELLVPPSESSYLIITHRNFIQAAQKFADWKRLLGYDVTIKYPLGLNRWTPESIKNTIADFANENPNFYNILILGDHTKVPPQEFEHINFQKYGYYASDFHYSCLDGEDDLIPDVAIGRIPCSTLEDATNVIDKIINYERYPADDPSFYNRIFVAGEYEDSEPTRFMPEGTEERMFIYTCETIKEALSSTFGLEIDRIYATDPWYNPHYWSTYYVNGNKQEMPKELFRPDFQWNGSASDVTQCINKGTLFGLYRGHSVYPSWGTRIKFSNDNVKNLNNKFLPVIFSITCQTGAYNKDTDCLSNSLLIKKNSGAVGVIAATEASYSGKNDVLSGAMLRAMYPQSNIEIFPQYKANASAISILNNLSPRNQYSLGQILNIGTSVVSATYGDNDNQSLITKRLFHCFGDPSLLIRKFRPDKIGSVSVLNKGNGFYISCNAEVMPGNILLTVVDTVSHNQICRLPLQECFIEVDEPDNCKICISGNFIAPIVFDGYSIPINNIMEPTFLPGEFIKYANFSTGVYDEDKYLPNGQMDYTVDFISDNEFEVTFNGAYIFESKVGNNSEQWVIRNSMENGVFGDPYLPIVPIILDNQNLTEDDRYDLISSSEVYFDDVDCSPVFADVDANEMTHWDPIVPYNGYKPFDFYYVNKSQYTGDYIFYVYPLAYNWEDRVMRAYYKLRFKKHGDFNCIKEHYLYDQNEIYYSIDGNVIATPKKGNLYIKCSNGLYSKVIY